MFVYWIDNHSPTIARCSGVVSTERWYKPDDTNYTYAKSGRTRYLCNWERPDHIVAWLCTGGWTCVHEKPETVRRRKFWLEEYDMVKATEIAQEYYKSRKHQMTIEEILEE